ncbi:hypothetical protein [Streptomyces rishiriensis]|uniref:hypothetical protein n=1 Tax=Streptomyces rishiriensis TaxID=68264 RepID=UPI00358F09D1
MDVTTGGLERLTASAASPPVAQLLQQAVARQAAASGTAGKTVDVVAAPAADRRGSALVPGVLPPAPAGPRRIAVGAVASLLGLRGIRAVLAPAGGAHR